MHASYILLHAYITVAHMLQARNMIVWRHSNGNMHGAYMQHECLKNCMHNML